MDCAALDNLRGISESYPDELLRALMQTAATTDMKLFLVGGTVRDGLLGRMSHDLDIAVSGAVLTCAKALQCELGGGTLVDLSGPDGEAIRVVWRGEQIDFSAFRAGAQSIEEDLPLRDFSINAMAVQLSDLVEDRNSWVLLDPCGGLADLQRGRIRHCPGAFPADPVRMLRGYRMCATLGFHLEAETREAIVRYAPLIVDVAAERTGYELKLIFNSQRTTETLLEMSETGLLRRLLPELYLGEGVEQPEFHHLDVFNHCFLALQMMEAIIARPEHFFPGHGTEITSYLKDERVVRCLKWAALMHDIGKPDTKEIRADKDDRVTFYRHDEVGGELFKQFADRSKWSNADTDLVGGLITMHMHPFHLCNVQREGTISKRAALKLCHRAEGSLTGLFLLAMSDSLASRGEKKPVHMEEELVRLFETVEKIYDEDIAPVLRGPRLLTGKDLIERYNLNPGPLFSEILDGIELARVERKVVDRKSAFAWVNDFLQERNQR
ncbi:MAG: HD domain-containing protein [Desulforhopalus sp.]